uniref:Uncharacterized protein n=1 Tax=viral metagenome TaxID=1070528 RepID=A0A6C0KMM4_9ZZZZ
MEKNLKQQLKEQYRTEYEQNLIIAQQIIIPKSKKDAITIIKEHLPAFDLKLNRRPFEEYYRSKDFVYLYKDITKRFDEDIKVWMPGDYLHCQGITSKKKRVIPSKWDFTQAN